MLFRLLASEFLAHWKSTEECGILSKRQGVQGSDCKMTSLGALCEFKGLQIIISERCNLKSLNGLTLM